MKRLPHATAIMVLVAALLPAIWITNLVAQSRDGYIDAEGNWVHDTNLGFEVIEAVNGFTADGPETIEFGDTAITLPQAKGIYWGSGDTQYGYGIIVTLPRGTQLFFSLVEKVAFFEAPHGAAAADDALILGQILRSATGYRVVANRSDLPADAHQDQGASSD